jgi:hypothetical protein
MNLARRCARVIAALQAAGADEALVRFIQPIAQAFLNRIYEDLELRAVLRRAPVAQYGLL